MARRDHPIHGVLLESLGLQPGHTLLDLGCGQGGTLYQAHIATPGIDLIGVDRSQPALDAAQELLPGARLLCADLALPIELPTASVDRVVSHNVLECLAEPQSLVAEAARLLVPGGRAVWSHVDFGGIMFTAADNQLSRGILAAYADLVQPWMDHADGHMGRKLPSTISGSSLHVDQVAVHTNVMTELTGDALARADEIAVALQNLSGHQVPDHDVQRWRNDLDRLAAAGQFFFMEPTVVVTCSTQH